MKRKRKSGRPRRHSRLRLVILSTRVPLIVKRKLTEEGAGETITELVCDRWPEIEKKLKPRDAGK